MSRDSVGELEYLILLAILALGDDATAPAVRRLLTDEGRTLTRGALYRSLDRLGEKALIDWTSEPPADGSGHTRRRYAVTATGREVVRDRRATLERLWAGAAGALDG
ncbi:MAG: helix-turn-helix transcriptional regulator [Longimicrobiales bacterium]